MKIDYNDAELEHLIRDPSAFIASLKRFMNSKKLDDSVSHEVENALHSLREQLETLSTIIKKEENRKPI